MIGGADSKSHSAPVRAARVPSLNIRLSTTISAPSTTHNLLIGFHFGARHPDATHPAIVSVDLATLEYESVFESWWYRGEVRQLERGQLQIMECDEYAAVVWHTDEADSSDLKALTRLAYQEVVDGVRATGHPSITKIWNYIGGINNGDGDLERYRQFSAGRADAFCALGIRDQDAPTGTAIGTRRETGLTLIALCSKFDLALVENPRQVSAFHYPRQYGPRSPKFSRGGLVRADTHHLCLISGTAAVVGHESRHSCDVARQTDETLRNLRFLCDAISLSDSEALQSVIDGDSVLRVYLRHPQDLEVVAGRLQRTLGRSGARIVYLGGAICRRELLVEIDGAKVAET